MLTSLRSIAFVIDEGRHGARPDLGDHAAMLALEYGAHLIGIYGVTTALEHPASGFARGSRAINEVSERLRQLHEQKALAMSRRLADLVRDYGISVELRVMWTDRDDRDLAAHSLHCDLVVIGHPLPSQWPGAWSPERIVTASGVPVLVVPEQWHGESIGNRVVLAWNGSREARRAITDAMPFIGSADWVKVLVVDADSNPERHGAEPGADIAHYLARHGARVEVERITSEGAPVAEAILAFASDTGADMVVIGAYSHARLRELLFGGATRTLLAQAPVPLLVSR